MWGVRRSGAALVACAFLLPCAEAGASSCAKATAAAGRLGPVATARSLGCLLAAERARRGLGALREHRCLRRAATGHSRAMVRRRQFAHGDVGRRVRRCGYTRGAKRWRVGEALAWGDRRRGSPRALLRMLLRSPAHRALLLDRGFSEVGIGVARGAPRPGVRRAAVTVTLDFGARR